MSKYESQRAWSDKFIPMMRQIIGPNLLEPSSFDVDTKQATDLVVLRARDHMIAARVRRYKYASSFPYEFTIRSQLDSGTKTELQKLVDGWGDWMFYAFSNEQETGFSRWWLINLHAWRAALIRDRGSIIRQRLSNCDGTHFVAFNLLSFPADPPILIDSSHPLPSRMAA